MYDEYEYDDWQESEKAEMFESAYSALAKVTADNPRDQPCPTCGRENMLTPKDVRKGYQGDCCADREEGLIPDDYQI